MMEEVKALLERYWKWLRDETTLRQIDEWVEITTPYLDRHNDFLQIYARRHDGGFVLTDDGYTVADLEKSGCSLGSPRRKTLLATTLKGFGVRIRDETKALEVPTSPSEFALRKHNLVQAMLAVNDLFYLAPSAIASFFQEDVEAWLNVNAIRYEPNVRFSGRSGYDHRFEFVVRASRERPERVLRTIDRPSRDTAQSVVFSWLDTREGRAAGCRAYAILNDSDRPIPADALDAFRNYGVQPVPWSDRDEVREELAA